MNLPKPKAPRAVSFVVWTRVRNVVKVYGPYRKPTALKYKAAWQEAMGGHLEARVVRLDKFENFKEGMKKR